MKYLILDELNNFECIGSDCPYTCCANWKITIDAESMNFYQNVEGEFGEKLKASILSEDETNFFVLKDGRCPFLNSHSLCDIYINLGEENMCSTCKTYPRKNWAYGDLTFIGKYISCPEVARILFNAQSPLQFSFTEDISVSNEDINWTLFNQYVKGMTTSIQILQNHELDFSERMRALLLFNYYFQNHLDSGKDCTELFDLFASTTSIMELTMNMNRSTNFNSRIVLFVTIAQNISQIADNAPIIEYLTLGIDLLNKTDYASTEELLNECYQLEYHLDISHIHEQYGVYFLSMYYMNFMNDKRPYSFIVQFFALFYLHNCFEAFVYNKNGQTLTFDEVIKIYTRTARVYEHSYENKNLQTTFSILEKNEMTSLPFLLSLI